MNASSSEWTKKKRVEFSCFYTEKKMSKRCLRRHTIFGRNIERKKKSYWDFHENKINDLLRSFVGPLHIFQAAFTWIVSHCVHYLPLLVLTKKTTHWTLIKDDKWMRCKANANYNASKMNNFIFSELNLTEKPMGVCDGRSWQWHATMHCKTEIQMPERSSLRELALLKTYAVPAWPSTKMQW